MVFFISRRTERRKVNQPFFRLRSIQEKTLEYLQNSRHFFIQAPCLFFALHILLGMASYQHFSVAYFFFLLLIDLFQPWKKILLGLLCAIFAWGYLHCSYPTTVNKGVPMRGEGILHIQGIQKAKFFMKKRKTFKGSFRFFMADNGDAFHHVACLVRPKGKTLEVGKEYFVSGSLIHKKKHFHQFKMDHMKPLQKRKSLQTIRLDLQKTFERFLKKKISDKKVRELLFALVTGQVNNHLLKFSFNRLGLAHVLAISGFHFVLFIGFFSKILTFTPYRTKIWLLLCIATFYFFFVGMYPSVLRAWLMVCFFLVGKLLEKKTYPLNILGAACIVEILIDPMVIYHLGFQLSFLCCIAIFLFYKPMHQIFSKIIKVRTPKEKKQMACIDRLAYKVLVFFRQSFSLIIAVFFLTAPVILFYFHNLALFGLIYNLFIPPLIGLLLTCFFACMLLHLFLPFWSHFLFESMTIFAKQILKLITYPPTFFEYSIRINYFPFWLLIGILSLLFYVGMHLQIKNSMKI